MKKTAQMAEALDLIGVDLLMQLILAEPESAQLAMKKIMAARAPLNCGISQAGLQEQLQQLLPQVAESHKEA